jgi:sec-independent protein translocase protein TatA
VFGARRLPEIGRSLGSGMREFKDSVTGASQQNALPPGPQQQQQAAAPAPAEAQPAAQPVAPAVAEATPVPAEAPAPSHADVQSS